MVQKFQLPCCALCQLCASDKDSIFAIQKQLMRLQQEAKQVWKPTNRDSGERATFTIVAPGENNLEQNLIALGFEHTYSFPRRNGYEPGVLKMYMKHW